MPKSAYLTATKAKPLVMRWYKRRRSYNVKPQPRWMRKVRVGDVLRTRTSMRVVRAVTFYACGALANVTFTIRHCSWTGRCETTVNYTDLLHRGFYPAGHRVKLNKKIDREIAAEIMDGDRRKLDCCDVKAVL